jgi:hypothetical protein
VSSVGLKEDGLRLDRVQKSLAGGSDCESQASVRYDRKWALREVERKIEEGLEAIRRGELLEGVAVS